MGPDPYRDWLAIETAKEAPNHYELLGISLFMGDSAAVRQAFEDRYALVRRYEGGNYGDRALALMAELSDAFKCLTNEDRKSQYDRELHETLAARETASDIGVLRDTLVEQISELEEIVDSAWQDSDPLGVASLTNSEEWGSMPVLAASNYLTTPAVGPQMEAAGKREVAIPFWLAALCTCGAALFVIGVIAVAVNILGSRDDRDSVAIESELPNSADDHANVSAPVPGTAASADTANSNERVEWSGRLARVLVDEAGTLHLLVASSDRFFEARTKDRDLIEQLAGYVCCAEDAELADDVRVVGTFIDELVSFFDPERHLRGNQNEFAVLELQSLNLVENTRRGDDELTAEEKKILLSLRSVGRYTPFVATVSSPFESVSRRFHASFHDRDFVVEIPAAWQALGVEIRQGQTVSVVARTVGGYALSKGVSGIDDMLLLEVETIGQPSFQQVVQSPSQFMGKKLTYQATLHSTLLNDDTATLSLEVQNEGIHFSVKSLAGIVSGQDSLLEEMNGGDLILVELRVTNAESPAKYEVVSATKLNDPTNRIVFNAAATSKSKPMPLAERLPPKPGTKLALTGLPDYVDLPPLSSQALELLMLAVEVAELEIEFASDLIALESAYAFVAKKAPSAETPQWQIYLQKRLDVGVQEAVVAHLTAVDNGLAFGWAAGADNLSAGQLRNCIMQLKSGGESHRIALRSPLRPGPTPLPTSEDKFQVKFELADWPKSNSLARDVEVLYDGKKAVPQGGTQTNTLGQRLTFKLAPHPDVEIQVSLLSRQGNSFVIQAVPRLQLSKNRQITLSAEDVDDVERQIRQSIVRAQKDIARGQSQLAISRNALRRTSNPNARAVMNGIMQTQSKKIAINQQSLAEMVPLLDSIGELRALVATVRSNALIRYRIYAESNETRLLLVDGDYREQEAIGN